MTSKTKMIKEQQEKQKLAEIAKRELEVQVTAADANTVNFEEVFQDNLPQKAIDLEQFVKTFEKDATNDETDAAAAAADNATASTDGRATEAAHHTPMVRQPSV